MQACGRTAYQQTVSSVTAHCTDYLAKAGLERKMDTRPENIRSYSSTALPEEGQERDHLMSGDRWNSRQFQRLTIWTVGRGRCV